MCADREVTATFDVACDPPSPPPFPLQNVYIFIDEFRELGLECEQYEACSESGNIIDQACQTSTNARTNIY